MKTKLIIMLAAGATFVSAATAEIVLTEDLSLSGYLDLYAQDNDLSGDYSDTGVAEFEMVFDYTTEPYFAKVELSYDGEDVGFETAIVGWKATEELTISAGNILSYLGWETYDSTGLFQYSYAYRDFTPLYPAYAVGAAADYVTDEFSLGVWVGDSSDGDISYEIAGKFTGVEGFTLFGAWADDPAYETINFWASYEIKAFTFAVEYIDVDYDDVLVSGSKGYLAMVNYAFDKAAITLRYSLQQDDGMEDWELFTISPSYTFSDNLLGLAELSLVEGGSSMDLDYQYAVELIYTF